MRKRKPLRRAAAWLAAVCLTLPLLTSPAGSTATTSAAKDSSGEVVGYYAGWSSYLGYAPSDVPAEQLTQINYAFAAIDGATGKLVLDNPTQDKKNFQGLLALKKRNPALRIVLSVGGWDYSTYFSDVAATAKGRETFAQSCVDLITAHGLDGMDLDWEYPVSGGQPDVIHRPRDKENFTLLLQAIRDALDRQERRDGKEYVLTIAGAAGSGYLSNIQPQAVAEIVDHVFLMTYDIHGPWDKYADLNAPLYTPTDSSPQYRYSVDAAVSAWLKAGVPAEKLVLGMPLYGYIYQGVRSTNSGLYSTFSSAKSITYDQLKKNYLSSGTYRKLRHAVAQVPYLYGNGAFISYDDVISIAAKAQQALERGLGGIGFWELSQDAEAELVSSACTVFTAGLFRDVPPGAWYADAVAHVYEEGWMQGITATTFSPAGTVTRGMLAAILHRMEGTPNTSGTVPFQDVKKGSYYEKAITWAAGKGILEGYGDGTFRPDAPLTRQQLAAILFRYASWLGETGDDRADLSDWPDGVHVEPYAREAMAWAVDVGLIQGRDDGRLDPGGTATRAQTAVLLVRLWEQLEA